MLDLRMFLLQREDASLRSQIDDLYWTYTRCARGKPPVLVRPDLYVRRKEIAASLRTLRDRARAA